MKFIERLMSQAKEIVWEPLDMNVDPPPPPTETQTVRSDMFDRLDWSMLRDTKAVKDTRERLSTEFEQAEAAVEDLFNMLHKQTPTFRDAGELDPDYLINLSVLERLFQTDEVQALRKSTAGDSYATLFVIVELEPRLREAFERAKEAQEEVQQAQQQEQEAQEQLQQALAAAQQAASSGKGRKEAEKALQQAIKAAQKAADQSAQAQSRQEKVTQQQVEQLTQGMTRAKENLDAGDEVTAGYGIGDGELQRMSFDERLALMQKLNRADLAKRAKLFGAFRQYADGERRRRVKQVPPEVHSYELGNDLTKLSSQESVNLVVPELEELFWLRWARHELVQKRVQGPDKQGMGPILVVCDESGSMGMPVNMEHTREAWSKALCLALCDQAKRDGRDFHYIGFSSAQQVWHKSFPSGHAPVDEVVDFTTHFFAGGTEYVAPLTQALKIVREYGEAGKPKPDIVFITDDQCYVTPEFVKEWHRTCDEYDIKVYGIQIGEADSTGTLRSLTHRLILLDQLNSTPEGMTDLFRQI